MSHAPFGSMQELAYRVASSLSGALHLRVWIVTISAVLASVGLWWLFAHRHSAGLQDRAALLMAAAVMWTLVASVTAALRAVPEWWASVIITLIIAFCLLQGLAFPSTSLRWVTLTCLVGVPLVAVLLVRPSWVGAVCVSCAASAVIIALHLQEPAVIRWYVAVTMPAIVVVPTAVMAVLLRSLERARAQAAEMAVRDPLTGLSNRRGLQEKLATLTNAAAPHEVLTLTLADVDHFKKVNDEFGHQVGDAVLVGLSEVLRRQASPKDLLVRMGGEEIAWVSTTSSALEAHRSAERLRAAVQDWYAPGLPRVTISVGVAVATHTYSHDADAVQTLLGEADRALYDAKAAGRNRVGMPRPATGADTSEGTSAGLTQRLSPL